MNCDKWKANKKVNPVTNRKISPKSTLYNNISKMCADIMANCEKLDSNPDVNPLTNRKLKDTSFFKKLCDKEYTQSVKKVKDLEESEECFSYTNPLSCTLYKNVTLKDHQTRVCNYITKNDPRGLVLFHSVGSGKTITSITVIRCLLAMYPKKKVFVVTPKSLVDNFHKELAKLNVKFGKKLTVSTYTRMVNDIKENGVKKYKNNIIIIDEAHNLRTQALKGKGKNVEAIMSATNIASHVYLLTATPVLNNKVEFTNMYAMVTRNETILPKLYKFFADATNKELRIALKNKISYFKNTDKSDYPAVTYKNIEFEMTDRYYDLYMQIEEDLGGNTFFADTKNLSVFLNGIRRAVNNVEYSVPTPKVVWSVEHIQESLKKDKKVLIYSTWIKSGSKLIQDELDELDIPWVQVNGTMSQRSRTIAVNKYNSGKVKVIFISSAGAEGLDLKATRSVIIMEPHWNSEKLRQVIGRAVRYKSHESLPNAQRTVDIYHLLLRKPEDRREIDRLKSADAILMNLSEKKDSELTGFFDILIKASI